VLDRTGDEQAGRARSSDFLDFTSTTARDVDLFLRATSKYHADSGEALHTVSANGGGEFRSSPLPRITAVVPEPSTWALSIAGFALAGLALRRRRTRAA